MPENADLRTLRLRERRLLEELGQTRRLISDMEHGPDEAKATKEESHLKEPEPTDEKRKKERKKEP